ncbi:hypothetical protein [Methylobacterium goesingense]|uniref:Uncharacterized protein n=1 Tax=Methylobacterium goesingense TaxID=243690 RepID=A0ABV2L631_9HYPH|nr:hypothetical protein [Methylobacterium goesingense]
MITIEEAFDSTSRLFIRADQHVEQIGIDTRAFTDSDPYEIILEHDEDRGDYVHKARIVRAPISDFSVLLYEAVNAFRSCLDHSIYASTRVLLGREPERPDLLEFPFGRDEKDARRKIRPKSEADPEIIELAMSFRPYVGGDDLLYSLDKMRNIKSHRTLIDCALDVKGLTVIGGTFVSAGPHPALSTFRPFWDHSKKELVLFRSGQPVSEYNVEISTRVVFSQASPSPGEDIYRRLYAIMRKVQGILVIIEAETDRIVRSRPLAI